MLITMSMFLLVVVTAIYIFFLFRNEYIYNTRMKAVNIVNEYCEYLIKIHEYDSKINYFKKYLINYYKHLFCFWLWGVESSFKKEYLEEIKDFM